VEDYFNEVVFGQFELPCPDIRRVSQARVCMTKRAPAMATSYNVNSGTVIAGH